MHRLSHNRPLLLVLLLLLQVAVLPAQTKWRCLLGAGSMPCCVAATAAAASMTAAPAPSCCSTSPEQTQREPAHAPRCCCDEDQTDAVSAAELPQDLKHRARAHQQGDSAKDCTAHDSAWSPTPQPRHTPEDRPPDRADTPPPRGARGTSLQVLHQTFLF